MPSTCVALKMISQFSSLARSAAAESVAAADDDGDLDAHFLNVDDFVGDGGEGLGVDAGAAVAHERFAGKFEEDALVSRPAGVAHRGALYHVPQCRAMRRSAAGIALAAAF